MESSFFALHELIIDVDLHVAADLVLEDFVDQPLICSSNIFEIKRFDFVAVQIVVGDECRLLLILRHHSDLVVAKEGIHEAE